MGLALTNRHSHKLIAYAYDCQTVPMRTRYILIDYENVQPTSLAAVKSEPYQVRLFTGIKQTTLPIALCADLMQMGPRAELIQASQGGKEALDFILVYTMGAIAATDTTAAFCIISHDKGYDSLVKNLRERKRVVMRYDSLDELTNANSPKTDSLSERVTRVVTILGKQGQKTQPGTIKALKSYIKSLFQNTLSDKELQAIMAALTKQGYVATSPGAAKYTAQWQNPKPL